MELGRASVARAVLWGVFLFSVSSAQSWIPPRAVVNAGSFARPGLAGGSIARGSIFTVFGTRIGPATVASADAFPLADSLGGTQITLTQGDTVLNAIPLFVSENQINAILPSGTPLGAVSLRVTTGTRRSNPTPIVVVESSVGIFTANGSGYGPGVVQNFETQAAQPFNSPASPAAPEQVFTVWATGLGAVDFPDNEAPTPGNLDVGVKVWVGDRQLAAENILYAGRSPCCAGVDQLVGRLPVDVTLDCHTPVRIGTANGAYSNTVTMATAAAGSACEGSLALNTPSPHRVGLLNLVRTEIEDLVDHIVPVRLSAEIGFASFRARGASPFVFEPLFSLPPEGSCYTYQWRGGPLEVLRPAGETLLDAGDRITLRGAGGLERLEPQPVDAYDYFGILGGAAGGLPIAPFLVRPFLVPGEVAITADGGADIGAIASTIRQPDPIDWLNAADLSIVDRGEDLTFEWAPFASSTSSVVIAGVGHDQPIDSSAAFVCRTGTASASFTVPSRTLSAMPASRTGHGQSQSWLYLGLVNRETEPFAEGLDSGAVSAFNGRIRSVIIE